jgi:proline racemase
VSTSRGQVTADLAYAGAIYASVRAQALGLTVRPADLPHLITIGREVRDAVNRTDLARHPTDPRLSGVYGTIWYDEVGPGHQRNCTVFADGEVDRSPCGSGTSARLALLYADGALHRGENLVHESIIGTTFEARVVDEANDGGQPAVLTEVRGSAYRTGEHTFTLDPADPLGIGFQLR